MFADINGTTIYYETAGEGPTCFVLHGGLGLDSTLYQRTLKPLAESLNVVFVDFRSNGKSARVPIQSLTMELLANDVVALADHLGIDKFLVLGHSYGGFIAQELALRYQKRLLGAVLVCTRAGQLGANEDPNEHPIPPRPDNLLALPKPTTDEENATFWDAAAQYFTNPDKVDELRTSLEGTTFRNDALIQSDVIYETWSTIDRLGSLKVPTLVIAGENDLIAPPADSMRIADRITNGTFRIIEGANHWPWIETPGEFFAVLNAWLEPILGSLG